jgi:hypothetical protein
MIMRVPLASPRRAGALQTATSGLSSRTVEVAERGEHRASLSIVDRYVVCQAVGLTRGPVGRQSEDRALSDKVRGRVVLVQIREYWSERLAGATPVRALNPWRSCTPQNGWGGFSVITNRRRRGRGLSVYFMLRYAALCSRRGIDARDGPPSRPRQPLMQPA